MDEDMEMTAEDFRKLSDSFVEEARNPLSVFGLILCDSEVMEEFEIQFQHELEQRKLRKCN